MLNMNTIRAMEKSERITLRKSIIGNLETLCNIYREESSPALTVTRYIETVGAEAVKVTVASLVNEKGGFDGRISRSTYEWAASIDGALDEEAAREMGVYTCTIHPAHLEQIARSTIRQTTPTEPTDPTTPTEPTEPTETETAPAEINEIAPDHITLAGVEMATEWSVSSTGRSVFAFYELDGERFRVTFTGECREYFEAAMDAAKNNRATVVDGEGLSLILGEAVHLEKRAKPKSADPSKQRHGEVPEKWFIGQSMKGKSWTILFDGDAGKTRVIFPRKPSAKVLETVKAAGFFWSPSMMSWNKGLNFRAFRAAEKLHATLNAMAAA